MRNRPTQFWTFVEPIPESYVYLNSDWPMILVTWSAANVHVIGYCLLTLTKQKYDTQLVQIYLYDRVLVDVCLLKLAHTCGQTCVLKGMQKAHGNYVSVLKAGMCATSE